MNSKFYRPGREIDGAASNQQLRAAMNVLQGMGSLSNINLENGNHGPPLSTNYLHQAGMTGGGASRSVPPPLPPRQGTTPINRYGYPGMNRYSGMSNYYSPFGPSRYSSGLYSSMYSPMSSLGMPYGRYGAPSDSYNNFLQMAEESTRPAFESIESVVNVVNSISMMLESTYGAVHSSYSAILGVVDQFSRLKDHFAKIFSVLAMLRGLHWLCLKVLYLLGLRKTNPSVEKAWQTARKATVNDTSSSHKGSAWPFLMFLSLVVGAPWLMFKLLSRNVVKKPFDPKMWMNIDGKKYIVSAAYDFTATQSGELSFQAGEKLVLLPQDAEGLQSKKNNWISACNQQNESGLVPVNYLNIPRRRPQNVPNNVSLRNHNLAAPLGFESSSFPVSSEELNDISFDTGPSTFNTESFNTKIEAPQDDILDNPPLDIDSSLTSDQNLLQKPETSILSATDSLKSEALIENSISPVQNDSSEISSVVTESDQELKKD